MAKKSELETIKKIKKLSSYIEPEKESEKINESIKEDISKKVRNKKQPTFKTSEVVVIMIITIVISLGFGTFAGNRLFKGQGERVEKELQNFINDYEYIVDNYNGDVNEEALLKAALNGVLGELDENSTLLESSSSKNFNINLNGSYTGLGIEIFKNDDNAIEIYRILPNSPAEKMGLKVGDIIVKYNNEDASKMTTEDIAEKISNNKNKTIELTYLREGKKKKIEISSNKIVLDSVATKTFEKNNKKIGYIGISIFAKNTYQQFKEKYNKLKKQNIEALVIDLRSNSGGYLISAENIISLFLDSSHPIYQIQKDNKKTKYYSKGNKDETIDIAILVNGSSASASEVTTSALSEQYKALVIGEKTFGKGSVQELQDLTGGDKFKLTTKNWLTSKGKWVDKKGIEPDIKVSLNKEYFNDPTDDNDNQLQKALEELSK